MYYGQRDECQNCEVKFREYDAVVPEVSGDAHIAGRHELYFDKDNTFKEGFRLR